MICASGSDQVEHRVLTFLPPKDLARVASVCRAWDTHTTMLFQSMDLGPLTIIDASTWGSCLIKALKSGMSVIDEDWLTRLVMALGQEVPSAAFAEASRRGAYISEVLHRDILSKDAALASKIFAGLGLSFAGSSLPAKRALFPIVRQMAACSIENDLGLVLLQLPQGLSFAKLHMLFKDRFATIRRQAFEAHGMDTVKKPSWFVMSNGLFKDSKGLTLNQHEAFLRDRGCRLPSMLAVVSMVLLTERPCLVDRIYTRCIEKSGSHSILVRNGSGLTVSLCDDHSPSVGVLGMQRI